MTKEQFEEFLESIGGLENGWYADKPPITKVGFFSVSPGWYPLIKELIEKLIAVGWDKKVTQVKEKFGGLRFYIQTGNEQIWDIIQEYEEKSLHICEVCGKEGSLRTDRNWITTLCDEHSKV